MLPPTTVSHDASARSGRGLSPLTVFAFLWACQALVHQDFYSRWLRDHNVLGWLVTVFGVATFLWPRVLPLFALMIASSVVYNVDKWPFVVNHILMESVINLTILGAIATVVAGCWREGRRVDRGAQNAIFERFAPVVRTMLIVMYYFAFLAKLNTGFLNPDLSCVSAMWVDLRDRFPFLPETRATAIATIGLTLVVEAAIPVLLTFRRTRYLAIAIGLPFHFMLGLIGHRTFSALAYALYGLFCIRPLTALVEKVRRRVHARVSPTAAARALLAVRALVIVGVALLMGADLMGFFRAGIGPLKIFRAPWAIWILWSLAVASAYVAAMASRPWGEARRPLATSVGSGFLWLAVPVMVLNGLSQYIGLKTETGFTMYSNLRTENRQTNHLFMPVVRVASYQDDLVEILDTDLGALQTYVDQGQLITYFELRRVASSTDHDFIVRYRREGMTKQFHRSRGVGSDVELSTAHPTWMAKLLYFRPVDRGDRVSCLH